MKLTTDQIEWIKMNKDMIQEILVTYRVEALEMLSSATPEKIAGLQFLSEEIKGTLNNLENLMKKKDKKSGNFTGV